jgi:threonine/homoserine/homoserine lactone efflux protein
MYAAIFQGVIMGLILSTFCGPIFFMLINLGIRSTLKSVFYLAFGVFVSDAITIFLLLYVALGSISEFKHIEILYYIGGAVLIYFGVKNLIKEPVIIEQTEVSQKTLNTIFIKGFMINSLNPTILFFWFGAMMLAFSTYHNDKNLVLTQFITGLIITLLTDCMKGYSAFHLKKYIKPSFLKVLNKISGVIIIGFGLKLIFFH